VTPVKVTTTVVLNHFEAKTIDRNKIGQNSTRATPRQFIVQQDQPLLTGYATDTTWPIAKP
jgi:hypothetical protein